MKKLLGKMEPEDLKKALPGALDDAFMFGHLEVVKELLEVVKELVSKVGCYDASALGLRVAALRTAALCGLPEEVKKLLDNMDDKTLIMALPEALQQAVEHGRLEVVKELLGRVERDDLMKAWPDALRRLHQLLKAAAHRGDLQVVIELRNFAALRLDVTSFCSLLRHDVGPSSVEVTWEDRFYPKAWGHPLLRETIANY